MSTSAASMRRPSPSTSPTRRLKRKASEPVDVAGPSSGATRSRTSSRSPLPSDYAPSSTTPSPVKRQSLASSSRRNSRQSRTFQIADDHDQDQDAPFDEDLDADGEFDEEFTEADAEGEDNGDIGNLKDGSGTPRAPTSTVTPARQSARPKRSNATAVAYYDLQPLPGASDEEPDEVVTPSVRRRNKTNKLPPTSDVEVDADNPAEETPAATARSSDRGTRTNTPSASRPATKPPRPTSEVAPVEPSRKRSSAVPEEPELSEEAKQQAKAEKEAQDLQTRWAEEYFEIVEQLPLELHRTFALMRELEGQMQTRVATMVQNMTTYRDARLQMQKLLDSPHRPTTPPQDGHDRREDARGSSEDEAENLLGGSQAEHVNRQTEAIRDNDETQSIDHNEASSLLGMDARRELLRAISSAANESVKAAEEKMNLAATAYDGIDRHIRRLDADISKLESSILLGLRAGTEESRGAREALGLPLDDDETAEAAEKDGQASEEVRTEAETASLTKAAGAANRAAATSAETDTTASGKRMTRSGPKTAPTQPATSPRTSPRAQARSRSLSASASASAAGDKPSTSARQKTTSPAPTPARSTRKRKPHPLSPQKGGRRSIATNTPLLSPTTQTLRDPATVIGPDTSDMPVDPAEPRYCYCDQVSFDEMVACDNEDCKIEWFHYVCVGLTRQPKKEWYCRFCAPDGWKGEGMGVPDGAKHRPPGYKKGGIQP